MGVYAGRNHVFNNTMIGSSNAGGGPAVARIFGSGTDETEEQRGLDRQTNSSTDSNGGVRER